MTKNEMVVQPHVYLSDRFFTAVAYAAEAHKDQVRKSTNIAYISHPFGVAALVLEAGGDEDQAIAGLLHDVAEDCGGESRLVDIASEFGERVAKIVRACSDSLEVHEGEKAPWTRRKEEHLRHLRASDADVLLVTAADKTHNARAIATDIQSIGVKVWERFNPKDAPISLKREQIIWYYDSVYEILVNAEVTTALLNPLKSAIEIMKNTESE